MMSTDFGDIPLKGIIPPLVTPLEDRDTLDVAGLERLIEHVISGGVHGVFILGSTGEGPSLSYRLRREMIQETCRLVDRRVPVLVGVTDSSVFETTELARAAADLGADAVVLAAPYYFPANQQELQHFVTEAVADSPLPLFLYNMPSHTKLNFDIDTVRRLINVPGIVGLKDSSGDMLYFNQLLELAADRPDFTVLMGPEQLMAQSVLMGGHGSVCGGANLVPELFVKQYEAAISDDVETVRTLQKDVLQLADRIYSVAKPPSSYLRGLKCALSCAGICSDTMAPPFSTLIPHERDVMQSNLAELGIIETIGAARWQR